MKAVFLAILFLSLSGCALLTASFDPAEPRSEGTNPNDRSEGALYAPAKGIIKKGHTSGHYDGHTYVCADKDCKTAVKVD